MPVLVSCSCGRQLRVPDEIVGKNIRCPACKAVVLATPSAPPTIPTASAPETDTDAAMIRFTCGACGKEMQALVEYGGQETACPDCNASVMIPVRGGTAAAPVPQPPAAVRTRPPDLPAAAEAESPSARRLRSTRRGRRRWPWFAGASALLLLGLGLVPWLFGYGVFFYFFRNTAGPDLALIPADAQGFVSIRAADLWKTDALLRLRNEHPQLRDAIKKVENDLGLTVADCERITIVFKDVDAALRPGGDEREAVWWAVCYTSRPYDKKKVLEKFAPGGGEHSYQNRKYQASDAHGSRGAVYLHTDRVFVAGPKPGVQACLDHLASPKTDGPLKAAIKEAAGKHQLVVGVAPPSKAIEMIRTGLPDAMQPLAPLLNTQSLLLTGDVDASLELELTLTFGDAAKAGEAKSAADALKRLAIETLDEARKSVRVQDQKAREMFEWVENSVNGVKAEQKKETVVVQMKGDASGFATALSGLVGTGASRADAFAPAPRSDNLKRLALALRAYHDDAKNQKLPPAASLGQNNKPLLSWRVHLLPYLGQEQLYRRFNLKEDWNSPQNSALLQQMPAVYRMPDQPATPPVGFMTYYKVFVGKQAPFEGDRQLRTADISDGLGKTIAIAEATNPVEWTRPDDTPFDPATFQTNVLGRGNAPRFSVVMFDGTVYTYSRSIDLNKLKALITYRGGEPVAP
jgi:DNA-directed RNA polymerase subunit RPC12/RpoP